MSSFLLRITAALVGKSALENDELMDGEKNP